MDIKLLGGIGEEALTAAAEGISYTLVFAVMFSVLQFVFLLLVSALRLVDHVPVLGKLNKLGGAVLGFFWMFLLCLLLGNVFFTYVPKELRHQWGFTKKAVQNTVLMCVFAVIAAPQLLCTLQQLLSVISGPVFSYYGFLL